jgi:hypothetical protein
LMAGTYKVDIFADGSHIGSSTLQMDEWNILTTDNSDKHKKEITLKE